MKKIFLLIILFCSSSLAAEKIFYNKLNSCKLTKRFINNYEPLEFNQTNNLLKQTGEQPVYCGEKIIIKGTILDQRCVPVSDAKIYLWQAGCDGKYPYKPLRTIVSQAKLNMHNGSTFTGSGIATSNNEGEFYFITIHPKHKMPINIRVEHQELGTWQTQLQINQADSQIYAEEQNDDTKHYNFRIVMPGKTLKNY